MKKFKLIIIMAVCLVIVVLSFSGCDNIFGHDGFFGKLAGSNSGGCKHPGGTVGCDDETHYVTCKECGEKYNIEKHTLNFGNDDKSHYNYCVWCGYRLDVQPHDYGEWNCSFSHSYRRCTHEYCRYEDLCKHADRHYTVTDEKHYFTCDKCEYDFTAAAHDYNNYVDITEDTHTPGCVCGKQNSEPEPHDLQYKNNNGSHWKKCCCGFETEKTACEYGEYLYNESAHYRICSICKLQSPYETHSMYLTSSRQRQCEDCAYIKHPDSLLTGTWEYTYNSQDLVLNLLPNWAYTIKGKHSGTVKGQGDYDIFITENADGTITGTIKLSADSNISFKFEKGETDKFRNGYRDYYRK